MPARSAGVSARERGFTLLEAIVAMVLVSMLALAVFGWISTNVASLDAVRDVNAQSDATINIVEHMRSVNPMLTPTGEADLGAYRIDWEARPITAVVDRRASLYQFALYDTRIKVLTRAGQPWFDVSLELVGYRKVRSISEEG